MWQFWLIAAGIFFVIEMATVGFFVFWFGIGALISMVVSFFVPDIYIQAIVFVVSSTILIFLTKPLTDKFVRKDKTITTNAYSIIGKVGIVTKEINPIEGLGQVKIGGETWSAKTLSEEIIPENTEIEVVKIDGVKAVVKKTVKSSINV